MRAEPPRDNLPPHFRCGDPLSAGSYLRMQDESEPLVPPGVQPSVPQDHLEPACLTEGARVRAKVEHIDSTLRQLDIALAIIYRLLPTDKETGEKCGISFESFRTECGPRAQIVKNGSQYDVCKRRGSS